MLELDPDAMVAPGGELEKAYIKEYLHGLGYNMEQMKLLPDLQRHDLLCAASMFASTRLAEVEAKSHLVEEMHGGERAL